MRLLSPFTLTYTEIQAVQKFTRLDMGQMITCSISRWDKHTILKIRSEAISIRQGFDYYIHERNINRLCAELRFKLQSMDKPLLEEHLADEKILQELSPLEYQFLELTGTFTPSRLLLHKNHLIWLELPLHDISTITRGKDNTKKGKPAFFLGILFTLLYIGMTTIITLTTSTISPGLYWGFSPFLIAGIISLIIGRLITFNHYLLIGTPTESYKLYAKRPLLFELQSLLSGNQPPPLDNSHITPPIPPFKIELSPTSHSAYASEKLCSFCGMKISTDAPFCPKCGSSL